MIQDYAKGAKPETKRAILICEGRCLKPKWHFYNEAKVETTISNGGEYGIAFYYNCENCGHIRKWGWEGIRMFGFGGDDD